MTAAVDIRDAHPEDAATLQALYTAAFPDEDLLPLLRDLRAEAAVTSLVGVADGRLVAHGAFTACGVTDRPETVALLGPLAVAPDRHGEGIGSALVRAGLERLKVAGVARVFVLGDPAYYRRFGFAADRQVSPPYPLPEDWDGAWQSLGLGDRPSDLRGVLSVPPPWRHREYWAP